MIVHSVEELIGHTPVYVFGSNDLPIPEGTKIYAKLEYLNPGGSVKDRLGQYLISAALERGDITQDSWIIEPTAGNTGIGVALAAQKYGLRTSFVVPEKFSEEKQAIMQALGAQIIHTPTEEGIVGAIAKAEQLAREDSSVYMSAQFTNEDNPEAYYTTLGPELSEELGPVTSFVAGVGSGGTFAGTGRYLEEQNPDIRLAAVEPEGSVLGGGKPGSHDIEGIGTEFIPPFFNDLTPDEIYTISDATGFEYTAELARNHGLLVGSSSGAALAASIQEAQSLPAGSSVVTIFADSGDRYLSKNIYTYNR